MIVVSDTSPLFYAAKIECEHLFPRVFKTVFIPPAVERELKANPEKVLVQRLLAYEWIQTQPVMEQGLVNTLLSFIDIGESEAIALAIDQKADYLLIDERRGTVLATKLQLQTVDLRGVLLLAKQAGHLVKIRPLIDRLVAETNFRYTPVLIQQTLQKANEL